MNSPWGERRNVLEDPSIDVVMEQLRTGAAVGAPHQESGGSARRNAGTAPRRAGEYRDIASGASKSSPKDAKETITWISLMQALEATK